MNTDLGDQIKLLSLSGFEISTRLKELIDIYFNEEDKQIAYYKDEYLIDSIRNTINEDLNNQYNFSEDEDLKEKLLSQLEYSIADKVQILIGQFIIDSIAENGRLDPFFEYKDVKKIVFEDFNIKIEDEDIEEVLQIIQHFDPPGCAFRSIEESMKIQLSSLEIDNEQKITLSNLLQKLINGKLQIKNLSGESKALLRRLSLSPGSNFGEVKSHYVRPDIIAKKVNDVWQVSLNEEFINQDFLSKIETKIKSVSFEAYKNTNSFFRGLNRRQQTLLIVSECLINIQENFIEGLAPKKAISNKEIAMNLKISTSTVSRILRSKYIQFPDKLIPMKDLLEKRINKLDDGADVTTEGLKILLSSILLEEDKKRPFSDENISKILKDEKGIKLSRRTVAKHRKDLKIPSSEKRQIL
tara:strand:+ start:9246 stop:10481 length:1236 start_codon:yes stop_codon:yes gene_type:complete